MSTKALEVGTRGAYLCRLGLLQEERGHFASKRVPPDRTASLELLKACSSEFKGLIRKVHSLAMYLEVLAQKKNPPWRIVCQAVRWDERWMGAFDGGDLSQRGNWRSPRIRCKPLPPTEEGKWVDRDLEHWSAKPSAAQRQGQAWEGSRQCNQGATCFRTTTIVRIVARSPAPAPAPALHVCDSSQDGMKPWRVPL